MTISLNDAERLRSAGFTEHEIEELASARDPSGAPQPPININSPAWQATINSRQEWIQNLISRGWSEEQIQQEIMSYYMRDSKRTPWDFLKLEYKPVKRTDYVDAARRRAKARISRELQGY